MGYSFCGFYMNALSALIRKGTIREIYILLKIWNTIWLPIMCIWAIWLIITHFSLKINKINYSRNNRLVFFKNSCLPQNITKTPLPAPSKMLFIYFWQSKVNKQLHNLMLITRARQLRMLHVTHILLGSVGSFLNIYLI